MFTYLFAAITQSNINEIISYIIMTIEAFIAIVGVLIYFFPENTKFGHFLRCIFKGFKKVQKDILDDGKINGSADNNNNKNEE